MLENGFSNSAPRFISLVYCIKEIGNVTQPSIDIRFSSASLMPRLPGAEGIRVETR